VAVRSNAYANIRLIAGVADSNSVEGHACPSLGVCCLLCWQRPLQLADHSSRGVLACVLVYWETKKWGGLDQIWGFAPGNVGV